MRFIRNLFSSPQLTDIDRNRYVIGTLIFLDRLKYPCSTYNLYKFFRYCSFQVYDELEFTTYLVKNGWVLHEKGFVITEKGREKIINRNFEKIISESTFEAIDEIALAYNTIGTKNRKDGTIGY